MFYTNCMKIAHLNCQNLTLARTQRSLIIMQPGSENRDQTNHPARPEPPLQKYLTLIQNPVLAVPTPTGNTGRYQKRTFELIGAVTAEEPQGSHQFQNRETQRMISDALRMARRISDGSTERNPGLESVETRPGGSPRFLFELNSAGLPTTPQATDAKESKGWSSFLNHSGAIPVEVPPTDPDTLADALRTDPGLAVDNQEAVQSFQSSARGRRISRPTDPHPQPSLPERRIKKEQKKLTCKCKNSKCVRLYCVCFSSQGYCGPECTCKSCCNNEENQELRKELIQDTLAKNPQAFSSKFKKINRDKKVLLHARGCHCRKTGCRKRYCECFKAKTGCTRLCRCTECKNDFIELTLEEVKANYEPVQRKRRRAASQLRLWATKTSIAEKGQKKAPI